MAPVEEDAVLAGPEKRTRAVVVMGVAGSGKSTLGARLAEALGCPFVEGDALHGEANLAKMARGAPLDDADRLPWLDRISAALAAEAARRGRAVAACSALRRAYRDRLRAGVGAPVAFLFLEADPAELGRRLAARPGHFMPASLLESQLRTLEPPGADEIALSLDAGEPCERLCERSLAWLGAD